jgi:hypothetical protein
MEGGAGRTVSDCRSLYWANPLKPLNLPLDSSENLKHFGSALKFLLEAHVSWY